MCMYVCVCHYYCTVVHSCEYWLHGLVKGGKLFSVHLLVLGDVLFFQVCLPCSNCTASLRVTARMCDVPIRILWALLWHQDL